MAYSDLSKIYNKNVIPDFDWIRDVFSLINYSHVVEGFDRNGNVYSAGKAFVKGDPVVLSGTQEIIPELGKILVVFSEGVNGNIQRGVRVVDTATEDEVPLYKYETDGSVTDLRKYATNEAIDIFMSNGNNLEDEFAKAYNNLVNKTGDTMSGDLVFSNNNRKIESPDGSMFYFPSSINGCQVRGSDGSYINVDGGAGMHGYYNPRGHVFSGGDVTFSGIDVIFGGRFYSVNKYYEDYACSLGLGVGSVILGSGTLFSSRGFTGMRLTLSDGRTLDKPLTSNGGSSNNFHFVGQNSADDDTNSITIYGYDVAVTAANVVTLNGIGVKNISASNVVTNATRPTVTSIRLF